MSCNHLDDCPRCSGIVLEMGGIIEDLEMERDAAIAKLRLAVQYAQAKCPVDQRELNEWIWACGDGVGKKGEPVRA